MAPNEPHCTGPSENKTKHELKKLFPSNLSAKQKFRL